MLIRNQNRRFMLSAESYVIGASCDGKGSVIAYTVSEFDTYITLGYYETDERALEVIDEIERVYGSQEVFYMPER
jgi:hypothetical protein